MKIGQFIAQFNYNDKLFRLVLVNNKLNCLCYDKIGKTCFSLNKEEKNVIVSVVQSLMVDEKRSYYVRDDKVGDNLYKIYFDPITRNHFWKSLNSNDNFSDNIYLNMKYNHEPSIVYSKDYDDYIEDDDFNFFYDLDPEFIRDLNDSQEDTYTQQIKIPIDKKSKIKTIIKNAAIGTLVLSTVISMTSVVYLYKYTKGELPKSDDIVVETEYEPNIDTNEIVIELPEESEQIKVHKEYSWEKIKEAINKNPNLTDEEKSFLYELKFVFDENHQYMDLDLVIDRLETLQMTYSPDGYPDDFTIYGLYHKDESNLIEFFYANNFSDVSINAFVHEFFHVLQSKTWKLVGELSNELFTRETIRRLYENGILDKYGFILNNTYLGVYKFGEGYEPWMDMWYDIAELLSPETLCEFQFQGQPSVLYFGLCDNNSAKDYNKAFLLIDMVNDTKNENYMWGLDSDLTYSINENINYFYELRGRSLYDTLGREFPYRLYFEELEYQYKIPFILNKLGKEEYLEYGFGFSAIVGLKRKSYYSKMYPESVLYLKFDCIGDDMELSEKIIESNGDTNKIYELIIDEEMELEYLEFVNESKEKGQINF